MVGSDDVNHSVGEGVPQRLPVGGSLDGWITFDSTAKPSVVFIAEPQVVARRLGCYLRIA